MFGKRKTANELDPPPLAIEPEAVEILRVWTAQEGGQEVVLSTRWTDPGAWGLVLVDIAQHAANAYARNGMRREEVLSRIRELFDAEWDSPTDDPREITRN